MLYGTPTLDECKNAAVLHKTTGDEKLFLIFLVRFELLGYYVMHRILRGCPWLRQLDMDDVKHTVIVGILRAFKTVRLDERPAYLPLRVSSYVRHELNAVYRYLKREDGKLMDCELDVADHKNYTAVHPKLDAVLFATSNMFTKEEKELLHRRYVLGETHKEISKALGGIGCNKVCRRLARLKQVVSGYVYQDNATVHAGGERGVPKAQEGIDLDSMRMSESSQNDFDCND